MRFFLVSLLVILFVSCGEESLDKTIETAETIDALSEYVLVNKIFQDLGNNNGDAVLSAQTSASTKKSITAKNEPIITVTPFDLTTFPKTITVDFKDGVLCKDGVTRKGIITIISSNWYREKGSEHQATFSNYYHEDYKVEGTHTVKNLGPNDNEELKYSITIQDGKITTKQGETITYIEDSFRTWVAGSSTPLNIWDDEYLLEGTQNGVNSKGTTYNLSIEDPLYFTLLPRTIKSGILNIDIGTIKDIELNYTTSKITILGVSFPLDN